MRHGVTEWNYAGRVQGRSDIPLAPEGERQARKAAERLAGETWAAIYSSPLRRAYQTAAVIAEWIGQATVITDARLVERNMGEAEGMPDVDLPVLWPDLPWDGIPGMEPLERLVARTSEALTEIAARHAGEQVVCVAHGSLIRAFVRSLIDAGEAAAVRTDQRTLSITTVRHDGHRFVLASGPDHRHILLDGVEYSGEKGRVSATELADLLPGQDRTTATLEPVVWNATAVESAWVQARMVGFARTFTDGVRFGCIDMAVVLPGYEHVRSVLISRLRERYPALSLTVLDGGRGLQEH